MNKKNRFSLRNLILLIIIGLLLWSIGAKYISQHEFIHHKIFERHGIMSMTKINYLTLNGVTYADDRNKCNDICSLESALNDIIGYNVALIIYSVVVFYMINLAIKKLQEK